jgi:hypothetical protein
MTDMVIAVFDGASEADAAIQDLQVARIPGAVIRREVRDHAELRDDRRANAEHREQGRGWPLVRVAVDGIHAEAVMGILNQYAPLDILDIEERTVQHSRR